MTKRPLSAEEFVRQLKVDPEYSPRRQDLVEAGRLRELELRRASEPLLEDLRAIGIDVSSVWDLVNSKQPFVEAQPVLFQHLQRPYPDAVLEGIARSMSNTAARPYWRELAARFRMEPDGRVRDGIAVALSGMAGPEEFDELVDLLNDRSLGTARVLLIWTVEKRFPRDLAISVLDSLISDPLIGEEAASTLKKVSRRKR